VVSGITENLKGVRGIVLRGSHQTDAEVDLWSDTDLLIILNEDFPINEQEIIESINAIGCVVGSEMYRYSEQSLLYRTAVAVDSSIHLLDAHFCSYKEWILTESQKDQSSTIIYGDLELSERIPNITEHFSFESYESNNTWFKYFMAIKKFARNDNLIGLHLLLDLVRDYLVVVMIERDIRHGTNLHRFGFEEQLPIAIRLSQLDISDKRGIFDYIAKLAYEYDKKLMSNVKGYTSRYKQVANYVEESKQKFI
jgi:hypothetical protein